MFLQSSAYRFSSENHNLYRVPVLCSRHNFISFVDGLWFIKTKRRRVSMQEALSLDSSAWHGVVFEPL